MPTSVKTKLHEKPKFRAKKMTSLNFSIYCFKTLVQIYHEGDANCFNYQTKAEKRGAV